MKKKMLKSIQALKLHSTHPTKWGEVLIWFWGSQLAGWHYLPCMYVNHFSFLLQNTVCAVHDGTHEYHVWTNCSDPGIWVHWWTGVWPSQGWPIHSQRLSEVSSAAKKHSAFDSINLSPIQLITVRFDRFRSDSIKTALRHFVSSFSGPCVRITSLVMVFASVPYPICGVWGLPLWMQEASQNWESGNFISKLLK